MKFSDFSVDSNNQILGISIHDSVVKEFHFISGDRLEIDFLTPAEEVRRLIFREVSQLGFRDFTTGMILAEMYGWELGTLPERAEGTLAEAYGVLFGGNYLAEDALRVLQHLRNKSPHAALILIESSFGGSIALVCENLESK